MLRASFYVCPVCGNVIRALGQGAFSCCGIALPPLQAEEPDDAHRPRVERIETDWYLTWAHPMEKGHFLSFAALVTSDGLQMKKLYPEQNPQLRFPGGMHGMLYWYCNLHGLFAQKV